MKGMRKPESWRPWPVRSRVWMGDTVISYGDLLFRSYVLRALVESKSEFSVVVDSSAFGADNRTVRDLCLLFARR